MDRLAPYERGALGSAAISVLAVVVLAWGRSEQADHTLVTFAWIVGLGALLVAAGAGRDVATLGRWRPGRQWFTAATIVAVAGALRLVRLDRFPRVVDSDGTGFALVARAIAQGQVRDPFTTGYLEHPILWSYAQRAVLAATGDSVAGARTLSALVGTAAVAATIAWGRRIGGWTVGLLAGALLAASPMHLQFSRLALNNVTDSLALPVVLVLLDRGVVEHRRAAAASAGIALGLAQYGYFGSRVLFPVVALVAVVLLVRARRRRETKTAAGLLGWTAIGVAVTIAPLAVHYLEQPHDLTARDEQVSIFAGWLADEVERTGDSRLHILGQQVIRAALLPIRDGQPTYRPPAPLVGWPLLVGSAIGLGVVLAGWRSHRHCATLAIAWVVPLAAIATTVGLANHRWVIGTPVVATTAAVGLAALGRALAAAIGPRPDLHRLLPVVAAVAVLAVGAVHAAGFFRVDDELYRYGDLNSLVATDLADELRGEPPGTRVYTAFAPRMGFRTHATVPFLAPHVDGHDVGDPITTPGDVPDAPPGTLFVFLPERLDELAVVRARHPGGEVETQVALGEHLYTTYRVQDVSASRGR